MECRADNSLGGVTTIELKVRWPHSSSTALDFTHDLVGRIVLSETIQLPIPSSAKRLFQGQGLPPPNRLELIRNLEPGDGPHLPSHHFHARRGPSTSLFRIPLPVASLSFVNFGGEFTPVKFKVRASTSVSWRSDKRLVTVRKLVDVVEGLDDVALAKYVRGNDVPSITVKLWTIIRGIIRQGRAPAQNFRPRNTLLRHGRLLST
ncbi:hypothetical protein M378DRAFT_15969 [Amanita muscaria Koide BX008]|uniref:Uncharacterized protein n=1 Tax=Amanita muscaria (strain Koide BX008) TaxID=946122 RepID=A0A0C2S575_AMAMK|nr:hypothetical protein M378DRAFT_15969 [Amanita muscaria Koide BX008]